MDAFSDIRENRYVYHRRWIRHVAAYPAGCGGPGMDDERGLIDVFSVAQSLPGIFAVNIAIFVGYKLKKTWGGFVCALGTILPSFVIMLLIALFFTQVKDNVWVEKAFMGLRPAVVA